MCVQCHGPSYAGGLLIACDQGCLPLTLGHARETGVLGWWLKLAVRLVYEELGHESGPTWALNDVGV